jgi:hypothetical protein
MAAFDVPESFDPNNLQCLLTLIDNLKACGVREFAHPCGLTLSLDTRRPKDVAGDSVTKTDEF